MECYYAVDGQKTGPLTRDEFVRAIETGVVTDSTLVWHQGMSEWRPFAEVKAEFGPAPGSVPLAPHVAAPAEAVVQGPTAFEFTGKAGEYFKIWIVNLLLTIVTLGIYAAWAKVRNRRYFYANTRMLGHAFDYTGNPVRILIGNLIVFGMALVYFTSGAISPFLVLGVIFAYLFLAPWLIVKSLAFNARNSTYRGLRFGFDGKYGAAAKLYVLLPIASVFTLYLLFPWVLRRQKTFVFGEHRYGSTRFAFAGATEELYKIFGLTLLFFIPLMIAYGGIIFTAIMHGAMKGTGGGPPPAMFAVWGLLLFPAVIAAIIGQFFFRAKMFNYTWNNVTLGRHRFAAQMGFGGLLGLQIVNALAVTFTLGLLYPWAKVRLANFTLKSLQFVPQGDVNELTGAGPSVDESAVGEAAADYFDFDIGLGL